MLLVTSSTVYKAALLAGGVVLAEFCAGVTNSTRVRPRLNNEDFEDFFGGGGAGLLKVSLQVH